jgi:hypothetical protein
MKLARREDELKQLLAEAQEERKKWEAKNGSGEGSHVEKKPLSATERARIQESAEFNSFFKRSARIMERALGSCKNFISLTCPCFQVRRVLISL